MTGTTKVISAEVRYDTLRDCAKKSVSQMQAEIDATIIKVKSGVATEIEEQRAAVLAKVILDRTSGVKDTGRN